MDYSHKYPNLVNTIFKVFFIIFINYSFPKASHDVIVLCEFVGRLLTDFKYRSLSDLGIKLYTKRLTKLSCFT